MESLEQRSKLKNILKEVFMPLVEHQQAMQSQLEKRVFNEVEDEVGNYNIYATIVPRKKLELLDGLLFPILEEDKEEVKYETQEIMEQLLNEGQAVISKIFLEQSYAQIKDLIEGERVFEGQIVTPERDYNIKLNLEQNTDYLNQEKELYNIFLENQIKWRTINNPYIRKFFDVVISGYDSELEELTDFEEVNFDLEELKSAAHTNYVPVWNIKTIYQDGEGFPLPAIDKIHYDHEIILENLGFEHGYLVVPEQNNELISVKKIKDETGDKLVITSDNDQTIEWEIMQVIQNPEPWNEDFEFELLTNQKKDEFMNKLMQENNRSIKTFAEINRLANSFQVSDWIRLTKVEILDKELADSNYSYDFNSFIEDEIRLNNLKEIMLLKFSGTKTGYLKYDVMSFIVSEIQMYFPEYLCKGVWE
ncbi:MAG: hypothetical protein ACQERJ_02405 [Bacillota bacterium]